MPKIEPRILKGTRDFLPRTMILRQYVMDTLRRTFEQFGFEPLETPAIEYAETFEGKSDAEVDKLLYRFTDHGGRRVALRYELNVALARVAAQYQSELVFPFKRYQMGPVWRADKPQKGRYREFWQCDVDIVGSASMLADAEVLAVVYTSLRNLGFERFTIRLNDRKILSGLGIVAGVPAERTAGLYRAIDKLERDGAERVRELLLEEGLPAETAGRLLEMVQMPGGGPEVLAGLRSRFADVPVGLEGVAEMEELLGYLEALGVPAGHYRLDLSMVRGLGYYTGPIYETVVEEPRIGSISGGGRYDRMVGLFGPDMPATGVSLGLERIVDVISELHLLELPATIVQALVALFDAEYVPAALNLAQELRRAGIRTEVYLEVGAPLGRQFRYADRKGIPYVLVIGPDEAAAGAVTVKEMHTGEQRTIPRPETADYLKGELARR
ncbi:MAG: histidine--tRNA ligase [Chloroflexia bacterium]